MTDTVDNVPVYVDLGGGQDAIEIGRGQFVGSTLTIKLVDGVADMFVAQIRAGMMEGLSIDSVRVEDVPTITTLEEASAQPAGWQDIDHNEFKHTIVDGFVPANYPRIDTNNSYGKDV